MTTTDAPDRFTALPGEHALPAAVTALEEHGFSLPGRIHIALIRQVVGF
jgi:hypothetical protein